MSVDDGRDSGSGDRQSLIKFAISAGHSSGALHPLVIQ